MSRHRSCKRAGVRTALLAAALAAAFLLLSSSAALARPAGAGFSPPSVAPAAAGARAITASAPAGAEAAPPLVATLALQQAELTAPDGVADDEFGLVIATDGDTAVIGAPYRTPGANANQGAAYVFTRSGTTWSQQGADLTAADAAANDTFGAAVALSGDTALIGAPARPSPATRPGRHLRFHALGRGVDPAGPGADRRRRRRHGHVRLVRRPFRQHRPGRGVPAERRPGRRLRLRAFRHDLDPAGQGADRR